MVHHGNIDKTPNRTYTQAGPEAVLVAEICARIIEWRNLDANRLESRPLYWLKRLVLLGKDNPDALWLYLHIQSGDLSSLTQTYQDKADTRATSLTRASRQAIEQKLSRAHQAMSLHFPELKDALSHLQSLCRPPRGINTKDGSDPNEP